MKTLVPAAQRGHRARRALAYPDGTAHPATVRVSIPGATTTARILATDDGWQDAASRAVARLLRASGVRVRPGSGTWNGWHVDSWSSDGGYTIHRATFVGPRERHGSGYPILAEARAYVYLCH